ncbi:MAG: hypothetical protein NZ990_12365 [Myxococcota bacterium]|nr:hypothetical protein [Myxococcota bacterium]
MPILPIIDLMIVTAWTSLLGACVLKVIRITTAYDPTLFGLGPLELTVVAAVLLLFALTLTARTWLKGREYSSSSAQDRAAGTLRAYSAIQSAGGSNPRQGSAGVSGSQVAGDEAEPGFPASVPDRSSSSA